jgi:hypothetical protein
MLRLENISTGEILVGEELEFIVDDDEFCNDLYNELKKLPDKFGLEFGLFSDELKYEYLFVSDVDGGNIILPPEPLVCP